MAPTDPYLAAPALTLTPVDQPLIGRVQVPGSKSITNRTLLLAALSRGQSHLTGALKSDDTAHMATALRAMGCAIAEPEATRFDVTGSGQLTAPAGPLFLGNAGTAMRFLTAAVAPVPGTIVLDGDAHMRKRPIAPLLAALEQLGVAATAPTGCPPVTVPGGTITDSLVRVDASLSSQYLSALLMMAPTAGRAIEVELAGDGTIGARGYVDLTLTAMARFGAEAVEVAPNRWRIAPTGYRAADVAIEPDASAATYLWAAEALTGGRIDLGYDPAGFTQPDAAALAVIRQFPHLPAVIDGAQMQDAVPTLAALAAFAAAPVRFVGIANLRVKECDRIRAMATELSRLQPGLAVEDGDDLVVAGRLTPATARPAAIETYSDHRIAMSLALAGLIVPGVTIRDPGCVAKTYPGFWQALASLGVRLAPLAASP